MFQKPKQLFLILIGMLFVFTMPAFAQGGVSATCPDGSVIENGAEVIINMRPGFTYTATALGINGFDPVIAVKDDDGTTLCNDDEANASTYSVNLPTTGFVGESSFIAQMPFSHSYSDFANISLVVGGFGNTTGEFVLVIEGLAVTSADGAGADAGDPFTVHITPNLIASGVPVSVYMISITSALDPLINLMGDDDQPQMVDGNVVRCDDAGNNELCWGESSLLTDSFIARANNTSVPGGQYDAMMTIPFSQEDAGRFYNWRMTSYDQSTFGDYIVAFHMGTGDASQAPAVQATQPPPPDAEEPVDGLVRQWASDATGTSQYGSDSWSFGQATGEPDTFECGDITTAWASATATGQDSLTLTFDKPVVPSQVNIHQTYNPGSIIRVELITESGDTLEVPDSADPPGNTSCPGVFTLDIEDVTKPINSVTIYLDQSIVGAWNEIDAVELVGEAVIVGRGDGAELDGSFAFADGSAFQFIEDWELTEADGFVTLDDPRGNFQYMVYSPEWLLSQNIKIEVDLQTVLDGYIAQAGNIEVGEARPITLEGNREALALDASLDGQAAYIIVVRFSDGSSGVVDVRATGEAEVDNDQRDLAQKVAASFDSP